MGIDYQRLPKRARLHDKSQEDALKLLQHHVAAAKAERECLIRDPKTILCFCVLFNGLWDRIEGGLPQNLNPQPLLYIVS